MRLDKSLKFLIIADPQGTFKLVEVKQLKIIREFYLGFGFLKMKLSGNQIIFLSQEREVVFYDI